MVYDTNRNARFAVAALLIASFFSFAGTTMLMAQQNEGQVEIAASADLFTTALSLAITIDGKPQEVQYYDIDGRAILEGDIELGNTAEVALINLMVGTDFERMQKDAQLPDARKRLANGLGERFLDEIVPRAVAIKAVLGGKVTRWPGGKVAYEIDPALTNPSRVDQAIAQWEASTPLRFFRRTAQNAAQFPNFIRFLADPKGGCSSPVGMQGGRQQININPECSVGNVVHEIGHAIGLQHEQSRNDRDRFVRIDTANIQPRMLGNFGQSPRTNIDIENYDYGSIMHYNRFAFAIDPTKPTIIALTAGGEKMGQRVGLSALDIGAVKKMYSN